jgi:hypothetical protein
MGQPFEEFKVVKEGGYTPTPEQARELAILVQRWLENRKGGK